MKEIPIWTSPYAYSHKTPNINFIIASSEFLSFLHDNYYGLFGKVISGHFDHSHLEWSKLFLVILNGRNGQMNEMGKMSVWLK